MAKCVKCGNELVYIEEDNVNYCPKCGEKYAIPTSTSDTTDEPKSLYEQFKAEIKEQHLIKAHWLIYIIAIVLLITCIAICATPISYNTRFVNDKDKSYYDAYGVIFQRNNICKTQYGSKTYDIYIYYLDDETIITKNGRDFNIIDRTTIQDSSGKIYKAENGGEIFLIVITVIWSLFAIILWVIHYNKKNPNINKRLKN